MTTITIVDVPRERLEMSPDNVREEMDWEGLENLARSIAAVGILEPIVVAPPDDDGTYFIHHGARRMAATDLVVENPAKYPTVHDFDVLHCIQVEYATEADKVAAMLIENLQREDLSPVAEAKAYARLTEDMGWKQADIAKTVGRNKSHITKRLQLLALPDSILWFIDEGDITLETAAHLVKLADHPKIIEKLVGEHGSVRDYEIDQALGKLDRQVKTDATAKRVAQHTDVTIVSPGGGRPPKENGHPYAPLSRAIRESAWNGDVPDGTKYVKVAMESWEDEPNITFFTDDQSLIDTKQMTHDQRQKYEAKLTATAEPVEHPSDPKVAASLENAKRQAYIEQHVREAARAHSLAGLKQVAHKPTIDQLLTLAHMDADELSENEDPSDIAQLLNIKGWEDSEYSELGDAIAKFAKESVANRRRLTFAIFLNQYRRTEVVEGMVQKMVGLFNEDAARAEAEAELNGQGEPEGD